MARLEITTQIGCPVHCLDCPQALLLSNYKGKRILDFEDYKKAIDKTPNDIRIDFSGMCEPFVNPKCADMILYAAEKGHPIALYTTLQYSTIEDYEKLKNIRYSVVTIHLPDEEKRSTFHITDEYLEVLSKWDCHNYSCHGTIDKRVQQYLKPRNLITYMHDRAGNLESGNHIYYPPDSRVMCANCGDLLDHNVLLPDGTVLVCCMDYGMTNVFGNLFTQSYEEILSSPQLKQLRSNMKSNDCLCKHCTNARRY